MKGIIININPMAFQVAGFEIRWYPIIIILSIFATVLISMRESVKRGLQKEQILSLLPWLLLAGIVGARLVHVIDRWEYYSHNLASVLALQQGGLAIWGAVAGGIIVTFIYARVNKIQIGKLFDTLVPGLLVAQIIGRVACIINGDAYGDPTTLPWGFIYTHPGAIIPENLKGILTHPYPVYEMMWNGIALFFLLIMRKRFKTNGILFLAYLVIYSFGRFLLTFVRQEKIWFWGLQEAQIIAIVILLISMAIIIYLHRKAKITLKTAISP